MNKKTLRKLFKDKRKGLKQKELDDLSTKISEIFFKSVLREETKYLHVFLPIEGKKEVNTKIIIDRVMNEMPEINLVISKCNFIDLTLSHYIYDSGTVLERNSYGVEEPVEGMEINPQILDLVLVPLLAFDSLGNRVGYGKGYYDRFLRDCKNSTLKVGLSLFDACSLIEDTNSDDIPLDICITPFGINKFNFAK